MTATSRTAESSFRRAGSESSIPTLAHHLVGQGGQRERQHAVEPVHPELLVGPVVGGLPGKEPGILYLAEGILYPREAAVGPHHLLR